MSPCPRPCAGKSLPQLLVHTWNFGDLVRVEEKKRNFGAILTELLRVLVLMVLVLTGMVVFSGDGSRYDVDSDGVGWSNFLRSRLYQVLLPVNLGGEHVVLGRQGHVVHVVQCHRQGVVRVVAIYRNMGVKIVLIERSGGVEEVKLRNLLAVVGGNFLHQASRVD